MNSTQKTIDNLLRNYCLDIDNYTQEAAMENNPTPDEVFRTRLLSLILEIVGKNESLKSGIVFEKHIRNKLRSEIRSKLRKAFE